MKCEWCRKPVPRVAVIRTAGPGGYDLGATVPPVLCQDRGRWVCTLCVAKRARMRDKLNAMSVEITWLELGLDRVALPEFAGR